MAYECDQCGACCKCHIIEAYGLDVLREPRLLDAQIGKREWNQSQLLEDEDRVILLALPQVPCAFLSENRCSIHPTRPNVCVGFLAGDDQCQEARKSMGLKPLTELDAVTE